jgi:hypothetical protein
MACEVSPWGYPRGFVACEVSPWGYPHGFMAGEVSPWGYPHGFMACEVSPWDYTCGFMAGEISPELNRQNTAAATFRLALRSRSDENYSARALAQSTTWLG